MVVSTTRLYTLINVDSFTWLPDQKECSYHAVLTDPPFGVKEFSKDQLEKRRNGKGGIWRLPQNYDGHHRKPMPRFTVLRKNDLKMISQFHSSLAPLIYRLLVPGGHVIISSQNLFSYLIISEWVNAGFEIRGQIARIVKTLRGGDRPKGAHKEFPDLSVIPRSNWEPWLIFRKPTEGRIRDNLRKWGTAAIRRPSLNKPFVDLMSSGRTPKNETAIAKHPSLKPQDFMRQLAWGALPLGKGKILDPFMGGGSTIAAATALGLRSTGIEIDKTYFEMAKRAIPQLSKLRTDWTPESSTN